MERSLSTTSRSPLAHDYASRIFTNDSPAVLETGKAGKEREAVMVEMFEKL